MIMLITLLGTQAPTRVGVGMLHTLVRGTWGSICLPCGKILYFYGRYLIIVFISGDSAAYFL